MVYGSRSHPLSYYVTKSLNIKYHASNIFAADTALNYQTNRLRLQLPKVDDEERNFGCTELQLSRVGDLVSTVNDTKVATLINLGQPFDPELVEAISS